MNFAQLSAAIQEILNARSEHEIALVLARNSDLNTFETLDSLFAASDRYEIEGAIDVAEAWIAAVRKIAGYTRMLAVNLAISRRLTESEAAFMRALFLIRVFYEREPDQWRIELANLLSDFSIVQSQIGKLSDAEAGIMEALEIYRGIETFSLYDPLLSENLGRLLNNLGNIQRDLGKLEASEQSFIESVEIRKALLAPGDPESMESLAGTLNGKGATELELNKYYQARASFDDALRLFTELNRDASPKYNEPLSLTCNNLGIIHQHLKNYEVSEQMFEQALEIRTELTHDDFVKYGFDLASTLNHLGNTKRDLRKFEDAENALCESVEIYQLLSKNEPGFVDKNMAQALNDLGNVRTDFGKYDAAILDLREALRIRRGLVQKEPRVFTKDLAVTLMSLGSLQSVVNKFEQAEKFLVEALEIFAELVKNGNTAHLDLLASTLLRLGIIREDTGRLPEAEIDHKKSLEIWRGLAKDNSEVFIRDLTLSLEHLGNVQRKLHNFFESEKNLREGVEYARVLFERSPEVYGDTFARILTNAGALMMDVDKRDEAEMSFIQALKLQRKLVKENPEFFTPLISMTLHNLGGLKYDDGNFEEAREYLSESLDLRRNLGKKHPGIFDESIANALNTLGNVYRKLGEFELAKESFKEALRYFTELNRDDEVFFRLHSGRTLNNMGAVQFELKDITGAAASFEKALSFCLAPDEKEATSTHRNLAAVTLSNLGNSWLWLSNRQEAEKDFAEARKNLKKALQIFKQARKLIDVLRQEGVTIADRSLVTNDYDRIYSGLLRCQIKMKDWKEALETAEHGKSRSLTDFLNLKSEDLKPKAPDTETSEIVAKLGEQYAGAMRELQELESLEKYLSEQLLELGNQITQTGDDDFDNNHNAWAKSIKQGAKQQQILTERKRNTQHRRLTAQSDLNNVLNQIQKYDRDFPPQVPEIEAEAVFEISKALDRTIVIFRILPESSAAIFVFPTGKLHIEEIEGFGQLEAFSLFRDKWLLPYLSWKESKIDIDQWKIAIDETLEEIHEKLLTHVRRILNQNSGRKILFVPNQSLALLPLHATSWNDEYGRKRYFLEDYTVSYASSVSVLKRCRENENQRSNNTLLITNPNGDLVFAEKEASFIQQLNKPNENLVGKDATKSAVIEALLNDYGFVHFCCHGTYDLDNPFASGLKMYDQDLTLSEIINCNLHNTWLTTLSACETGLVDFRSSTDEHFGLPLGFIFAGSPSVWASLWLVSDSATAKLMQLAYENLSKEEYKTNKPEALRQAQLAMIDEDFSHPLFWAGFQHIGI